MSILIEPPVDDIAGFHAVNFVRGMRCNEYKWSDRFECNRTEWPADGFVYFAVIGEPYITHVKVGFTTSDPEKRVKSLQTGCPFPIKLLGYVFGSLEREHELHDVFASDRLSGEWFAYSERVAEIIDLQLVQGPRK